VVAEPADLSQPGLVVGRSSTSVSEPFTFEIANVLPGSYVLRVDNGATLKSVTHHGTDYTHKPIQIGEADSAGVDEIVISLTNRGATVSGTISDAKGSAVTDATVLCYPVAPSQWTGYGMTPIRIRTVQGDMTGHYSLQGLAAGEYFVVAVLSSQVVPWQDPEYLRKAATAATRVSIDWTDSKSVSLVVRTVR
jgi:hypothetical protein